MMADYSALNPWLPTADWCGRLILPAKSARRDDGSVQIELFQVPAEHSQLHGQRLRLRLDAEWTERVSVPIEFHTITRSSSNKGMIHPERLNGWDKVSPMESLAGTRPEDDVFVQLIDPVVDGQTLVIQKEPVQISGTQKALARFVKQNDDKSWQIQHWNPGHRDFSGKTETVKVGGRDTLDPTGGKELNAVGWYLYANLDEEGHPMICGLEPRHLFQIEADLIYEGEEPCLQFIKHYNWRKDTSIKGQTSRVHLSPRQDTQWNIKLGDKALLLHLFGAVAGKLGRMAGHFSFGVAEVIECPFTGDQRFQVEHKQIYAHNIDGVVSGSSQWHNYMGDTRIGKMEIRSVCDYLVFVPEMFDDSKGESAYTILERRLAEMTARYRTGEGDGSSIVTSAQNCSQDSSQALYAAIYDWEKAVKAGDFPPVISLLCRTLREHITPLFGLAPWSWKRTAKRLPARASKLRFIRALKSWKTIIPRSNADGLAETAIGAGKPMVLLRTEMIGSTDDDLKPAPPIRPW